MQINHKVNRRKKIMKVRRVVNKIENNNKTKAGSLRRSVNLINI